MNAGYEFQIQSLTSQIAALQQENERLKAELSKHQESTFHPEWSMLQATRASLKEHQEIIRNQRTLLRELAEALQLVLKKYHLVTWEDREQARAALARAEEVLK